MHISCLCIYTYIYIICSIGILHIYVVWYTMYIYICNVCIYIYAYIHKDTIKYMTFMYKCTYIYTRWIKEDAELLPHTPWRWETSIGVATMLGPYAGFAMFCPTGGKWRQWRLHLAFTYINGYLIKVYMEHGYYYMGTIKWVLLYIYISITGKNLRHQKTIKHGDQGINIRHFTRNDGNFIHQTSGLR